MTDQEKIAELTRKLEELKGALEVYATDQDDDGFTHGEWRLARATLDSIASLSPEQPEKPEAVETGEPVAWRYRQESSDEWQFTDLRSVMRRFRQAGYEVEPLAVSDGEARRKALIEAAELADAVAAAQRDPSASWAVNGVANKLRALAAIPTAGDAK